MLNTILKKLEILRWNNRRRALVNELDAMYAARRYFDRREPLLLRQIAGMDTAELHKTIPAQRTTA